MQGQQGASTRGLFNAEMETVIDAFTDADWQEVARRVALARGPEYHAPRMEDSAMIYKLCWHHVLSTRYKHRTEWSGLRFVLC